jgi:serralysin
MPNGTTTFSAFNGQQIAQAEAALRSWSDVANIQFVRVVEQGYSDDGQIVFSNFGGGQQGYAAFAMNPGYGWDNAGDIWVNADMAFNLVPATGNFGRFVLAHEIGHALGLDHPGEGESYEAAAAFYEDSRQYTLMSHWSEEKTGAQFGGLFASAPLLDDIAAAQLLYGANLSTRTGNSVYGFNSNTGIDYFTASDTSPPPLFALWDAGGTDTFDFSGYRQDQVIDLREGHFSHVGGLRGNVSIAEGVVIERAIGGSGWDTLVGNGSANLLIGSEGVDVLLGLGGNDKLVAGNGLAVKSVEAALVRNSISSAVPAGAMSLGVDGNIEASTTIPHLSYWVACNGGPDYFAISVSAPGRISIDIDKASFDTQVSLVSASGRRFASNDNAAALDHGSASLKDSSLSFEVAAPGVYYVVVRQAFQAGTPDAGSYLLNISLPGAALGADLIGSLLSGGDGNDTLQGGAGADRLDGGAGVDAAAGAGGNDLYMVDDRRDTVSEASADGGIDTVMSSVSYTLGNHVEELILTGTASTNGAGNGLANRLSGNAAPNRLDGRGGADWMSGGGGNDTYVVDHVEDLVVEDSRTGGTDSVMSTVSYTLGSHVENLLLTGSAKTAGTGNTLSNMLTGNNAVNQLSGAGGNDRLYGKGGNDTLAGGSGKDAFYFDTALTGASNVDQILDFSSVDDTIFLHRGIFTGIAADGALSASAFAQGTQAIDADDRVLYDRTTGDLLYDPDGSGSAAAMLFAQVKAGLELTSADFHAFG